ncbi:MAG: TRAP transporter small permease [Rhodospirillales bacterium]|nr:TRAP transporter small permease [Rhodospirillales bacterium]
MPASEAANHDDGITKGPANERAAAFLSALARALALFAAALALLLPLPVAFEVVMDQLRDPPTWVFETSGYAIIMIVFAASGFALKTGHHFRVMLLPDRFPGLARTLGRVSGCCELAFGALLLLAGSNQAWSSYTQGLTSDTLLAVPQFWPQLAFPIGGLVIGLQGLAHLLDPRIARLHDAVRH